MMVDIDRALSLQGLDPWQRPLHISGKLWEAFGWTGNIFPPKELAQSPGYEGEVLMAKAHDWYERTYGDRLNSDGAYGHAPVRLGNALWRVRAGIIYGEVHAFIDRNLANSGVMVGGPAAPASFNVLGQVEGITQGVIDTLTDVELVAHLRFHKFIHMALRWRKTLPVHELFRMARADYDESTSGVIAGRHNQACWASQQAVEKTLKGLLRMAGAKFPSGGKDAHNLNHLANLLYQGHGIGIRREVLDAAQCLPGVRYGNEQVTAERSLAANHAVLEVLASLRVNRETAALLTKASNSPTT